MRTITHVNTSVAMRISYLLGGRRSARQHVVSDQQSRFEWKRGERRTSATATAAAAAAGTGDGNPATAERKAIDMFYTATNSTVMPFSKHQAVCYGIDC